MKAYGFEFSPIFISEGQLKKYSHKFTGNLQGVSVTYWLHHQEFWLLVLALSQILCDLECKITKKPPFAADNLSSHQHILKRQFLGKIIKNKITPAVSRVQMSLTYLVGVLV